MKVTITTLKAPWPAGAGVGDVVDLGDGNALPAWAVGKCEPAGDDTEAAFTWTPPAPPAEPEAPRDLAAELAAMTAERDELLARLAELEKADEPTDARKALEAEAKALGVSFNARTSPEVLAERIAAAKAAA